MRSSSRWIATWNNHMIRVNNLNRCGFDGIKTTKLSRKKKQRQRQGQNTGNGRMKKMLSSVPKKSISCRSKSTYLSKVECQPIFGFLNHVSSPFSQRHISFYHTQDFATGVDLFFLPTSHHHLHIWHIENLTLTLHFPTRK